MFKKIKNKISLPVFFGLITALLDLGLWVWFVAYGLLNYRPGIFEEGLLGLMILHMPSSILLPTLGSFILSPFLTSDSIVPQTIFLFIVGILQYFFIGYLLGRLVLFFKKKINKRKEFKKQDVDKKLS
ncbi:hypothetical protein A2303_05730 [Candidatus Falkowbacteria bacterium RIFOXYB2_FULL_47_14]|uniref:Uncharacterized protein n=1 Tax=Candidatus Falkowbacteria bacterium RIFOXYA2_FULL_47_19 TaxID=1797994 RepID=A0A1F5SEG5_9BACT|nr:MAG: hypothetical protein A2227_07130 [Candidatus Falkowbacteria bacterium RIFOXYA2_FULL_47_19]OGF35344.1 MAG: hypothetical protein A2468_00280 [Candidatus Falkowbacteria bacterium RIFOXYC2_FULL_46_15]OGF43785.1 MAG: hypothetical protein A2303_05730 [Candidatus Falkowbacteria bacterium RIFOXYB2_FULL_47_14]